MTIDDKFDINALAKSYGEYYKIGREKEQSDYNYRLKVAGELRKQGHLIEAHEALSGRRHDDPNQGEMGPMIGIMGALAKARQGIEFSPNDYEHQVGDDLCAGIIVKHENPNAGLESIFKTFGIENSIDFLDTFYKK